MKNIRDIFAENAAFTESRENGSTGQHEDSAASAVQATDGMNRRKRFCPVCYMNYEVTTNVCRNAVRRCKRP